MRKRFLCGSRKRKGNTVLNCMTLRDNLFQAKQIGSTKTFTLIIKVSVNGSNSAYFFAYFYRKCCRLVIQRQSAKLERFILIGAYLLFSLQTALLTADSGIGSCFTDKYLIYTLIQNQLIVIKPFYFLFTCDSQLFENANQGKHAKSAEWEISLNTFYL